MGASPGCTCLGTRAKADYPRVGESGEGAAAQASARRLWRRFNSMERAASTRRRDGARVLIDAAKRCRLACRRSRRRDSTRKGVLSLRCQLSEGCLRTPMEPTTKAEGIHVRRGSQPGNRRRRSLPSAQDRILSLNGPDWTPGPVALQGAGARAPRFRVKRSDPGVVGRRGLHRR